MPAPLSFTHARCCLATAALMLAGCAEKGTSSDTEGSGPGTTSDGGGGAGQATPAGPLDPDLGLTWSKVATGTQAILWDVVWTGSRLYAVGAEGTVLSSADGTSWTKVAAGGVGLAYVKWTGSRLVALDSKAELLSSENGGASWTTRYSHPDMPVTVLGQVGSTLVALGATEDDYWATSTDGMTWTVRHDPALTSLFFSNCASGPRKLLCVGWRNLINVSQGAAFETSDGLTWKEVSPDFAAPPLRGAGWKGDELIALGELGSVFLRTAEGGWLYRDSWATYDGDGTKPADTAIWTGKRAVAAGQNLLIASDSAHPTTWRRQFVEASGWAMAFTGRRLVLVGEDGNAYVSPSTGP